MPPKPRRPAAQARAVTGRRGEELAAAHLRRRGFTILDRNVRSRYGEIDLVACDGVVLAFVEVKTTSSARGARAVPPLERLGRVQRARVRRLALSWLLNRPPSAPRPPEVRFDAIGVVLDARGALVALEHLEGAW
jgi:putative endonuclease